MHERRSAHPREREARLRRRSFLAMMASGVAAGVASLASRSLHELENDEWDVP